MKWIQIKAVFETDNVPLAEEIVSDIFFSHGLQGIVCQVPLEEPAEGFGSDALPIPDEMSVSGYLPLSDGSREIIEKIEGRAGAVAADEGLGIGISIKTKIVDQEDWAESWKNHFHVTRITDRVVVKPAWREFSPTPEEVVIEIDPGMAFGTGTHATTAMCIALIEKYLAPKELENLAPRELENLKPKEAENRRESEKLKDLKGTKKRFLDVGTGSGILMIAAAKLGAASLEGIDTDEVAVQVALENLEKNAIDRAIYHVEQNTLDRYLVKGDLAKDVREATHRGVMGKDSNEKGGQSISFAERQSGKEGFHLVAANILAEVLVEIMSDLKKSLLPEGIVILSGIIREKEALVREALEGQGMDVLEVKSDGEWVAMAATR